MKIVIDARMINDTGIGRYVRNLVEGLEKQKTGHQFVILLRQKDWDSYKPSSPNFTKVLADYKFYGWGEQLKLPFLLRSLKPDLVHFPHLNVPLLYFGRYIVTIHDLTLVDYKNVRGSFLKKPLYEAKYWAMRLVLRHAIHVSRMIITDTKYVRSQILSRFHVKPAKVLAIPLAGTTLNAQPQPVKQLDSKTKFVLYVGNYYPHKNIGRLIEAMKAVGAEHPDVKLVLTGKADFFQQQLQQLARTFGLMQTVVFTGFVTDAELSWLYTHATGYVFPSLSEGFGLPGLEAMAQGVPVLAANASCLPEIYEGAAEYFDPTSPADISRSITHLLDDQSMQKRLSVAGKAQVKKYSWTKMVLSTVKAYDQLLIESNRSARV